MEEKEKEQIPPTVIQNVSTVSGIFWILTLFAWIAGVVIAKGIVSTIISIIFPPWAWYLFVEVILKHMGLF